MKKALTFEELPDDAFVRLPVAQQVAAKSRSKVYADSKKGKFPPIEKIDGGHSSGVRVGQLRRYLRNPSSYRARVVNDANFTN